MSYGICEHKHKFAVWAAGSAVRGLSVRSAKHLIEDAGLKLLECNPDNLPGPDDKSIDDQHRGWREAMVKEAQAKGIQFNRKNGLHPFTHGYAAKLINIYLKTVFVCGGHEKHPNVEGIHPPIDSELLNGLSKCKSVTNPDFWKEADIRGWTSYDSDYYEKVIQAIRNQLGNEPLWKIEKCWPGYQTR